MENTTVTEQVTEQTSEQTEVTVETQPQDVKTFTQEDLDRILTKRLEKSNKQWQEKFNALEESIKLQAMTEQEKANYQAQKELEAFEEERKAFYAERDAFNKEKYRATIQAQLQEVGLPTAMADMLVNMDAESVATQINAMKDMFSNQINQQVQAKVQASANVPTQPSEQVKLLTLDEIKSMSAKEITANKELVDKSLKALQK